MAPSGPARCRRATTRPAARAADQVGVARGGRVIQTPLSVYSISDSPKYTKRRLNDSTAYGYVGGRDAGGLWHRDAYPLFEAEATDLALPALDVEVILTPPCIFHP